MKKWSFFLFWVLILSGCGGGGGRGGNDQVLTDLQVDLTDTQGNPLTGETIRIEGPGGISFTCTQSPTQTNTNDPDKCEVPQQGQGNLAISLIFKSLPAENNTYTFTDEGLTPRSGSCSVTILNSTSLNTSTCDDIGAASPNQLIMTFTLT